MTEIRLRNHRDELPRLESEIDAFAAAQRVGGEACKALQLVLEELVTNVIRHGYDDDREHEILVRLSSEGAADISVEVEDDGRAFDPTAVSPPSAGSTKRGVGGRGIEIVRRWVDEWSYERRAERNVLAMRMPGGSGEGGAF